MADHGGHDVAFVVLNYDVFLERALRWFDDRRFDSMDDYIKCSSVRLFKIHGSIDWHRPIAPVGTDWNYALREFNPLSPNTQEIWKDRAGGVRQINNMLVYPVLTAPLANKGPLDLVCPDNHKKALCETLARSRKFLVIGTSGLDADLLDVLSKNARQAHLVHYVGAADANDVATRFRTSVSEFNRARTAVWDKGLARYVSNREFQKFLQATV